jgi:hypothetical protein
MSHNRTTIHPSPNPSERLPERYGAGSMAWPRASRAALSIWRM